MLVGSLGQLHTVPSWAAEHLRNSYIGVIDGRIIFLPVEVVRQRYRPIEGHGQTSMPTPEHNGTKQELRTGIERPRE